MPLSRRDFLRRSATASAGLLVGGPLQMLAARLSCAANPKALAAPGYGPLERDPAGLLDLPKGFQYRALSTAILGSDSDPRFTQKLTNGELVPARHDGMAAFAGPGGVTVLVRNHELIPGHSPAVDPGNRRRYDRLGTGGTTTLWVDANRNLVRAFPSLSGTFRNCAGGPTPWGSWLSAEECVYMPGRPDPVIDDLRSDVSERHGYMFEVDARAEDLVDPSPIKAMGRFYHEAVAVDPATGDVYLTEDRPHGLLYRYRPDIVTSGAKRAADLAVGDLARGGVLEALRIPEHPAAQTQNWKQRTFETGKVWAVDWVKIPVIDPDVDSEKVFPRGEPKPAATSTRAQGFALGATQFARCEGIALHQGSLYFCATSGGREEAGQVWRLDLAAQRLSLMLEPDDRGLLDGPDNIAPAPNGDLIVCEDGDEEDCVRGVTPGGRIYTLARNAYNRGEFAGACFSPDGRTMFVNMQDPGITFAIWGPWDRRRA
ncbi:MAG TPA: alkaline phosphatase PhoX [Candidatus Eisenbacteria bacterium]|nr:alkaline phosphatase PhoX [Candidatus Eisenbacteria bacterium]